MKHLRIFMFIIFAAVILFSLYCGKKKIWVAKIDGEPISLDEFNVRFEYYLKSKYIQNPEYIPKARTDMEERRACLKDMINEKLILAEAKKLKLHKREDVKNLIKLYTQQIIINAYIEEYLSDDIKVNEKEISEYYEKNKAEFRGVDPELAKRKIQYQLTLQKYDRKISEILEKLRGKYRIEENENAIRPIMAGNIGTSQEENLPPATIKKKEEKNEK